MQLRLAFFVAAFLEPEILIIDEVLAVGDAEFQKKCLGKMEDVSKSGRTILFVSHQLDAIESLCKRSAFLADGKLVDQGLSKEIIQKYISNVDDIEFKPVDLINSLRLEEFSFSNQSFSVGSSLSFEIRISKLVRKDTNLTDLCLLFYNYKKTRVAIYDLRKFFSDFIYSEDEITYEGRIDKFNLVEGFYYVGLYLRTDTLQKDLYDLVKLQVKGEPENLKIKPYETTYRGFVELN